MGSNRFPRHGSRRRRGLHRAVAVVCLPLAALVLGGCGGSSGAAPAGPAEKAADAEALNSALAAELTAIDAYRRGLPLLSGQARAAGRRFLAQDEEDVDAVTRALRGLGAAAEAEAEKPDFSGVRSGADFLRLAYELEGAALGDWLGTVPRLSSPVPRGLAAALAAAHAQRRVALRQALGAGPPEAVPEAFDRGDSPPPPGGAGN
ncbi:MAG TPA: ferritin-like domain-containing protein [Solirubrobacterales bacterium]|nr:ferritin-like domain-containing protein [Solirubrobacterales bacterium]